MTLSLGTEGAEQVTAKHEQSRKITRPSPTDGPFEFEKPVLPASHKVPQGLRAVLQRLDGGSPGGVNGKNIVYTMKGERPSSRY